MSRKRNDPVRRMRTRGYISRFVFRVCTLCMIGLRIGGGRRATQTETPAEKHGSPRTALGGRGRTCRRHAHGRGGPGRGAGGRWPVAQPHA